MEVDCKKVPEDFLRTSDIYLLLDSRGSYFKDLEITKSILNNSLCLNETQRQHYFHILQRTIS